MGLLAVLRARADNHQVSLPLGGRIDDLSLRSSFPPDDLGAANVLLPRPEYVLGRGFLRLTYLSFVRQTMCRRSKKAFAEPVQVLTGAGVNHMQQGEREILGKHSGCFGDLRRIGAVQTTKNAHARCSSTLLYRRRSHMVNAPPSSINGVTRRPTLK